MAITKIVMASQSTRKVPVNDGHLSFLVIDLQHVEVEAACLGIHSGT